ncbi:MAG: hypothetical protein ACO3XO_07530 [Bdellovibrionota bacterium]
MSTKSYNTLRNDFPHFSYRGFEIVSGRDSDAVQYSFGIEGLQDFSSTYRFPRGRSGASLEELTPFVARLGLIEALSYWKLTCSPNFHLHALGIAHEELPFWQHLFYNGLSEFRYRNNITTCEDDFVQFHGSSETPSDLTTLPELTGNLIPIGGGKDSIVTLEALSNLKEENTVFLLNPRPACTRSAEIAGYHKAQILEVSRSLDPQLLKLNSEGFLNGHTPFSALLAFTTLVGAALNGNRYIVLSNEGSASEGNIAGEEVNHQYSKSIDFESRFRAYVRSFLSHDLEYFSFLRPLHEVQIARFFAMHEQYFPIFRSCNVGCYEDRWCERCPKCLFTALILAPFTSLDSIFEHNPLENLDLQDLLLDLCLPDRVKPFECVGTREESTACAQQLLSHNNPPKLLAELRERLSSHIQLERLLSDWNSEHFLPPSFEHILQERITNI